VQGQETGEVVAPVAQIGLRSVSPNDVTREGITTGLASGQPVVGVGTTVYLLGSGITPEGVTITAFNWQVTGPKLSMAYDTQNITFSPPTEGVYTVSLTVTDSQNLTSAVVSQQITAAKWEGLRNCASCHGGQFVGLADKVSGWKMTGHASILGENLNDSTGHYAERCISCHTVGYDKAAENRGFDDVASILGWTFPDTLQKGNWENIVKNYPQLANLANIQCESCHGPGSLHYGDPNRIAVTLDSGSCAVCHASGSHHSKDYEWDTSRHAAPTTSPTGPGREGCVKCHTGIGFVQAHDPDYAGQPVSTEASPISCAVCHDPHNVDNPHQLRVMKDITLENGVVVTAKEAGYGILCINCHKSRRNVTEYVKKYSSHFGPHYSVQGDLVKGTGGFEYPGIVYTKTSVHMDSVENSCVGCHMAEDPVGSPFGAVVGEHSFRIAVAAGEIEGITEAIENVNACTRCHDNLQTINRKAMGDYDGDGLVEGLQDEVHGLMHLLGQNLPPLDSDEVAITADYTPEQLKAGYNYMVAEEDGSAGIHNPLYTVQLLQSSYLALTGMNVPNAMIAFQGSIAVPTEEPTPEPTVTPVPADAPSAAIALRSISPRDKANEGITTSVATGLPVVPAQTTVYLLGSGKDPQGSEIAAYQWTITGPQMSASFTVQNPTFTPPVEGIYKASLVVTNAAGLASAPATMEITSAHWMGIRNCASCHSGNFGGLADKVSGWEETNHAIALSQEIDAGGDHFAERCVACHALGYDKTAKNGGFDDVAAAAGWVFPSTIEEGNWAALEQGYPELANMASVQCESCHGPGSLHLGNTNHTAVSIDSGVCSTCHDSGTHHVKNYEWDTSAHAHATTSPSGPGRAGCVACHTGIGFIQANDPDYAGQEVSTEYAPITCATCHDPHNHDNQHQLRTLDVVTLGNGVTVTKENFGMGVFCVNCHKSRRNVNEYVQQYGSHFGPHYSVQGDVVRGTGGFEYPGVRYTTFTPHMAPIVPDTCVTCHMAEPVAGAPVNSVGGHSFRIKQTITGEDGTEQVIENLNACTSCHKNLTEINREARADYDGDGLKEGIQDEVHGLMHLLGELLPPLGSAEVVITNEYTKDQLKAAYNYMVVEEDRSFGIHNGTYIVQLLQSSYRALAGKDVPGAAMLITWPGEIPTETPKPATPTPTTPPDATPTEGPVATATPEPEPTATPTVTPKPTEPAVTQFITVTDSMTTFDDLSNYADFDSLNNRQLVIRWNLQELGIQPEQVQNIQIYVRTGSAPYALLAQTSAASSAFEWSTRSNVTRPFQAGPAFGSNYAFRIYVISKSGEPTQWGPFDTRGDVAFLPMRF
jgi:PKD repeat protein